MEEAHLSMNNLATTVQTIVESSEKMTHKLENIEQTLAAPSQYATSKISALPRSSDEALKLRLLGRDINDGHSPPQAHMPNAKSDLDLELSNSRVYLRTFHRHSVSSLPSASGSASGWSFLSGVSLAQISNISVLSLPLCPYEIWNPHHYDPPYRHESLHGSNIRITANSGPSARDVARAVERQFDHHRDIVQRNISGPAGIKRNRIPLMERANINMLLLGKSLESDHLQESALLETYIDRILCRRWRGWKDYLLETDADHLLKRTFS